MKRIANTSALNGRRPPISSPIAQQWHGPSPQSAAREAPPNGLGCSSPPHHLEGPGSVRAITDPAGARIESSTYKPYGKQFEAAAPAQPAPETKGWIGERYAADAGLQYLNAGYYDPELGMFIQPDWWEVTKRGVGTNRYGYSFGDPVNKMDPGGNLTVSDAAAMSDDAYRSDSDPEAGNGLPGHISRMSAAERSKMYLGAVWEDQETGFRAGAYRNANTGEVTVAYGGTVDFRDMVNDAQQVVMADSPQFAQARNLAKVVSEATPNRPGALSFAGHSLGGGLALEAAHSLPTGIRSVNHHRRAEAFNPLGLSQRIEDLPRDLWYAAIGRNIGLHSNVIALDPVTALNIAVPGLRTLGGTTVYAPRSYNPKVNHAIQSFIDIFTEQGQ